MEQNIIGGMAKTFSSVPVIDFARLHDPVTKHEELPKLRDAIFVVGFLYLTNTGLEVRDLLIR
jgi:isopenicillin N synthase-like dioxygenase